MSQASIIAITTSGLPPSVPLVFHTDSGDAVPAANALNVFGGGTTSTSGAGSTITVTTVVGAATWTDKAISFAAAVNNGYFVSAAATATLPAAPTQGQFIIIETATASSVVIQANTGQVLRMGSGASSSGGTATSSAAGNSVYLVYRSANTSWYSISTEGTWLLA